MELFSAWWSCFLFPLEISPAGTAASLELLAWPWYHTIFFSSCHFLLIWNTQKILYPSIWIITELAVKWKIAYKYDHFVNFHTLYSIRTIVICFKYPFSSYSILYFIYSTRNRTWPLDFKVQLHPFFGDLDKIELYHFLSCEK